MSLDVKRLLVGRPVPTYHAHHQRLGLLTGLAVLSSDPLSSVAYATEEILRVLVAAGPAAMALAPWIAGVIAALLAVIAVSYRQTIFAYPTGGGAYTVAKENIGPGAGLVAAAALLIDYVLTVAVSIAAGVAAMTSALPGLHVNRVELALAFLAALTVGNLRGVRESGRLFGVPVYFFVGAVMLLLGVGVARWLSGTTLPVVATHPLAGGTAPITIFMLLTAFANGCTAMTGVEAVSNGVPAFKAPESKHAAATLTLMVLLGITMFIGITLLAAHFSITPSEQETVVSQLARGVFGGRTALYYAVQAGTMLILVLAANTAFADFPRLSSVVARDRYMPRQFMNLGDKLAFSNGIVALSVAAGVLIILFGGDPHRLIPLYMVGVFLSFTLSQAGMFKHWMHQATPGWQVPAAVNGGGALVTGVVLVVVGVTKGAEGAWVVMLLIPFLVLLFRTTRRHYDAVAGELSLGTYEKVQRRGNVVLVPIGGVHRAVLEALDYARTLSDDVRAVYVNVNSEALEGVKRDWPVHAPDMKLVVLQSPFRSLITPILDYVDRIAATQPDAYVTVVVPEFVPRRLWQHLLHNQQAWLLKTALVLRRRVIVVSVPFHLTR